MVTQRALVMGASCGDLCGVRDYVRVLERALGDQGVSVITQWWERDDAWSVARTRRELKGWLVGVESTRQKEAPDVIFCHYSVFTWAYRGIPLFAPLLAHWLARCTTPIVGMLHEIAYPFRLGDWRGNVWAVTQRAAFVPLLKSCDGVLVTTDDRARWVATRRWLPLRPVALVPISSNLPAPGPCEATSAELFSVGVFGYGDEGFVPESVVSAVARLAGRGEDICLTLVGAPGAQSPQGQRWREAAVGAGCGTNLRFTGVLEMSQLSAALAALDVVVFPDVGGPTSRKTTLAAALACGRPVIALDGPVRWERLVREGGVVLVQDGEGLAVAIERLRRDPDSGRFQGERAAEFYRRYMAPEVTAGQIGDFLAKVKILRRVPG